MKEACTQDMHMKKFGKNLALKRMTAAVILVALLSGCGVNNIPTFDEKVKSTWGQVENQYQRRADLIPNLVETVKGFAAQEKETLVAVTEARSKVSSMQVDSNLINDPQKLQQFEAAQQKLSGALSRLMVVVERYPDLKSNLNFLALLSQGFFFKFCQVLTTPHNPPPVRFDQSQDSPGQGGFA